MDTEQFVITKETLKRYSQNLLFNRMHGLTDKDVLIANRMHDLILNSRDKSRPTPGDIIVCCSDQISYEYGHLNTDIKTEYCSICTQAYTPFVFDDLDMPYFSTSGGYWISETDPKMFEYIGERKKLFCTWGHDGACAGGAVYFEVLVNAWKLYREDIY
ncbi:MAG: DUF4121 family protein [Desulfobacula sp.]|nr:DUF4121 family protein [Desulfobacula sp.]